MNKTFKTKFLPVFLSFLMLFCMMPQDVLADSGTVTPKNNTEVEEALRSTTAKTIIINKSLTLNNDVIVGANHTLSNTSSGEIYLAGSCNWEIPIGTNLTVNGGYLACHETSSDTILVNGTLTLNNVEFEVKSSMNQINGNLVATDCKIKIYNSSMYSVGFFINSGNMNISGGTLNVKISGSAYAGIWSESSNSLSIENCDVELNCSTDIDANAIISNIIDVKDSNISIKNGGKCVGLKYGDSLTFDKSTVTISNTGTGIECNRSDSEFKIINGSNVLVENQNPGIGIYSGMLEGTKLLTIDDSILELRTSGSYAIEYNDLVLQGANNGKIIFHEGSKIYGMQNKIIDRGVVVTSKYITVGPSSDPAVANKISAGTYTWDGTYFSNSSTTPVQVSFMAEQIGGASGTIDSTGINITFNEDVTGLTEDKISITNVTGSAITGTLSGSGKNYTISLTSVTKEGTVNFAIKDFESYRFKPSSQIVNVFKNTVVTSTEVTFTAEQIGGMSGTADSTGINITFDKDVTGLTADKISITNGSGVAVKGTLSGSGKNYTISLASVTTEGTVSLSIANFGSYSVTTPAQFVNVYNVVTPTAITFFAEQTGGMSGTADSTGINIFFSEDVAGFTADKISITDGTGAAIKGTLSGLGIGYTISLTSVTTEGTVNLSIDNFGSYNVTTPTQAVNVYKNTVITPTAITFTAEQIGGMSGTKNSTGINITFSEVVTGLTEYYVSITDGTGAAVKGILSGSGSKYTISLTSVITEGTVTLGIGDFGSYIVTTPTQAVNVYKNTATGNNPDSSEGSGSATPKSDSNVVNGNTINATAKETDSILTSNVSTNNISDVIKNLDESKDNIINIVIDPKEDIETIKVTIANEGWKQIAQKDNMSLQIKVGNIILTLDNAAIKEIYKQAKKDIIIQVGPVDKAELTKEQQSSVGMNQSAYNLSIISDNKVISDFKGNIAVKLPYDINLSKNVDSIIVYHVGSDGMLKIVKNAIYNATTETVDFNTSHFSVYMVDYNYTEFVDVTSEFWGNKAIDFASARNLVAGVGNNKFEPNRAITRAEFTKMIYNVFELETLDSTGFTDVKSDAWYYTSIMSCKKVGFFDKLNITDDEFKPNQVITREEMAVILSNVAKYCKVSTTSKAVADLTKFSDYDNIDKNFADDIICAINLGLLDKNGIGNGKFDPKGSTTRAQAAQIQRNIIYILNITE